MTQKEKNSEPEVVIREGNSPDLINLLENTVFGTRGKTRYRQKELAARIRNQENIEFIQIRKGDRLLGTTGVINRICSNGKEDLQSLYIRYLSMWNPFRTSKRKRPSSQKRSNSGIRKKLADTIISHFELPVIQSGEKAAFYAFVESENLNSKELCISLGFHPTRTLSTLLYSRFFPKKKDYITTPASEQVKEIKTRLQNFYFGHSFYFEDRIFEKGKYFIAEDQGRIVAGMRANPVNWEIVEVPGWKGILMQKILPYLPLTSRLFDPKDLNFLSFDYMWCLPGYEHKLTDLMDHAAADFEIYTGMMWFDQATELHDHLISSSRLGLLHAVNGPVEADLMLRFINFEEADKKELLQRPVFISALDMS